MSEVNDRAGSVSLGETDRPQTRRERKKLRTRGEIYQAAMRLFGTSGYNAVTVDVICSEADVARTTFFAHFPSKSALLHEYGGEIAARFLDLPQPPKASATDRLRSLATLVMESWFGQAEVMGAMLLEFSASAGQHFDSEVEPFPLLPVVADIIRSGREGGEFCLGVEADVAAAAFLTSGAIFLAAAASRGGIDPEALRDDFLYFTLNGLAGSPEDRTNSPG